MSMYNHRGLGPAPGNARLNELLESVRAEFENQARVSGEVEQSSKSQTIDMFTRAGSAPTCPSANPYPVTHQINEMAMVREKVYNMEQAHLAMKSKYGRLVSFLIDLLIFLGMRKKLLA